MMHLALFEREGDHSELLGLVEAMKMRDYYTPTETREIFMVRQNSYELTIITLGCGCIIVQI